MERFLVYSLRWRCPIKLVWLEEGQMKTGNVTVVALREDGFDYVTARAKTKPRALAFPDVLAAGYARGDDGDSSKKTPPDGGEDTDDSTD